MIKQMLGDWSGRFLLALIALFLILIPVTLWLDHNDQIAWDKFYIDHKCKVVGRTSASVGVGYGLTATGQFGTVMTTTPGRIGYLCDDEITYWR